MEKPREAMARPPPSAPTNNQSFLSTNQLLVQPTNFRLSQRSVDLADLPTETVKSTSTIDPSAPCRGFFERILSHNLEEFPLTQGGHHVSVKFVEHVEAHITFEKTCYSQCCQFRSETTRISLTGKQTGKRNPLIPPWPRFQSIPTYVGKYHSDCKFRPICKFFFFMHLEKTKALEQMVV